MASLLKWATHRQVDDEIPCDENRARHAPRPAAVEGVCMMERAGKPCEAPHVQRVLSNSSSEVKYFSSSRMPRPRPPMLLL
eukprot:CAMPEP_0171091664 /NCGR_PEP_ID=MMETSP0766_2-20121228/34731_1 /TAXON_ID=439317 /ORGANISM="Gambierdiscus australes, Strain CAWD 149" /LENGTH=80 /DNA_ID=CAMNT_0011549811 /DNA_START=72 /DNA_END=314 /DNA_ORIENTATION=-